MDEKQLIEFKKKCIKDMPLRKAEKKLIADGHYLHQIHFDEIPDDEQQKKEWMKKELNNYFGLRCLGNRLWEEGSTDERFKNSTFSDEEFEDMMLLFKLPYLY